MIKKDMKMIDNQKSNSIQQVNKLYSTYKNTVIDLHSAYHQLSFKDKMLMILKLYFQKPHSDFDFSPLIHFSQTFLSNENYYLLKSEMDHFYENDCIFSFVDKDLMATLPEDGFDFFGGKEQFFFKEKKNFLKYFDEFFDLEQGSEIYLDYLIEESFIQIEEEFGQEIYPSNIFKNLIEKINHSKSLKSSETFEDDEKKLLEEVFIFLFRRAFYNLDEKIMLLFFLIENDIGCLNYN